MMAARYMSLNPCGRGFLKWAEMLADIEQRPNSGRVAAIWPGDGNFFLHLLDEIQKCVLYISQSPYRAASGEASGGEQKRGGKAA
jgi:hypothetical protein